MTCSNGAWLLSVCVNCVSTYIDIWNGWLVYLVKNRHAVIEIGIWSSKIRIKFKCNKHVESLNRVFGATQDYGNICRSILEHKINERRVKRNQSGVSAVFPHAERRNQMENSILRVHLATKCCEPYFECSLHSLIIQTNYMNGLLCADDFEIMILSIGSFLVGLLFHSAGHKKSRKKLLGIIFLYRFSIHCWKKTSRTSYLSE